MSLPSGPGAPNLTREGRERPPRPRAFCGPHPAVWWHVVGPTVADRWARKAELKWATGPPSSWLAPPHPTQTPTAGGRRRRRRRRRSHVGGNRARPPRGGAEGVAEEPPTRRCLSISTPPLFFFFNPFYMSRRGAWSPWSVFWFGSVGFRRQAGDVGRRDGQPHDLALHNPRQARGKHRPECYTEFNSKSTTWNSRGLSGSRPILNQDGFDGYPVSYPLCYQMDLFRRRLFQCHLPLVLGDRN